VHGDPESAHAAPIAVDDVQMMARAAFGLACLGGFGLLATAIVGGFFAQALASLGAEAR